MHDLLTSTLTDGLQLALWVAFPAVLAAFLVGLLISVLQAFTQLSEPALNAIARMVAVLFTLGLAGTWMAAQLGVFAGKLLHSLPELVP